MSFNTIKVNNTDTNYTHSIFDISEYNSGAIYANLSAALAAVPQNKQQGGMTVKFIQVTLARYSVVKTENLETEPTGTLLSEAPYIDSGTYDESQLSTIFSTLPSSTGASHAVTYYVAVTVDETTTYTSWVITKVQNSDNKYLQYRLMSDTFNTTETNWINLNPVQDILNDINSVPSNAAVYALKTEMELIQGNAVDVEADLVVSDPGRVYGENIMLPGRSYQITLVDYDATYTDSDKQAFAVYTNLGAVTSSIIRRGSDLSGTVVNVTIPAEATSTDMRGRANGHVVVSILDKENLSMIKTNLQSLEADVDLLEDEVAGHLYVSTTKDITGSETSTTDIYRNNIYISSGKTINITVLDPSGVTTGTLRYKLNNEESARTMGLSKTIVLTEELTHLRVYAYIEDLTGLSGILTLSVTEDGIKQYTVQNTQDIALNTKDIAKNTNNVSFIQGESVNVEADLVVSDPGRAYGANIMEPGRSYQITLVDYDATYTDSDKQAFAVYTNLGAVPKSIKMRGSDLSGTVIDNVTIPAEATYTDFRGRANGHVVVSIVDNESLTKLKTELLSVEADVDSLEDEVVNGYREEPTSQIEPELSHLFLNATETYVNYDQTISYIIPIVAGDTITIVALDESKGYSAYRRCAFTTVKPVAGAKEQNFIQGAPKGYAETGNTSYTTSVDGYFYVLDYYSRAAIPGHQVKTFLLNGESVIGIRYDGLLSRVSRLEESGGTIIENGLSLESSNPVQNKVIAKNVFANKMASASDMFNLESRWWILNDYLEGKYWERERDVVETFISKFTTRAGSGKYQIAVISDTHGSGAYSYLSIGNTSFDSCFRSIAVFNKIASYCNAALHGGDISCDYGTSRNAYFQYMQEILRLFRFNKPFFITKGNHDENNNTFVEADMFNLDWTGVDAKHPKYYTRLSSTFTPVVSENAWNGNPLYESKTELISDREFRNFGQHYLSPNGAVWADGAGAYYYYDIDSVKIRFIVANSFPINNNHVLSEDEEYIWFADKALNFSNSKYDGDRENWAVIVLRHTQATRVIKKIDEQDTEPLKDCINAFQNGTTWIYNNYRADFNEWNGGGMKFIAHIHGHEHQWCFSNGAGYFDIGENSSFVTLDRWNTYDPESDNPSYRINPTTLYGISVWTIDTVNGKVYEDTINGHTWCYNYLTQKLEIVVGESIIMAESGLERPVAASSEYSNVTCSGRTVTAVSAGECTVRVTGSNGNYYDYLIKVVENY